MRHVLLLHRSRRWFRLPVIAPAADQAQFHHAQRGIAKTLRIDEAQPLGKSAHRSMEGKHIPLHASKSLHGSGLDQYPDEALGQAESAPVVGDRDGELSGIARGCADIARTSNDAFFPCRRADGDQCEFPARHGMHRCFEHCLG